MKWTRYLVHTFTSSGEFSFIGTLSLKELETTRMIAVLPSLSVSLKSAPVSTSNSIVAELLAQQDFKRGVLPDLSTVSKNFSRRLGDEDPAAFAFSFRYGCSNSNLTNYTIQEINNSGMINKNNIYIKSLGVHRSVMKNIMSNLWLPFKQKHWVRFQKVYNQPTKKYYNYSAIAYKETYSLVNTCFCSKYQEKICNIHSCPASSSQCGRKKPGFPPSRMNLSQELYEVVYFHPDPVK